MAVLLFALWRIEGLIYGLGPKTTVQLLGEAKRLNYTVVALLRVLPLSVSSVPERSGSCLPAVFGQLRRGCLVQKYVYPPFLVGFKMGKQPFWGSP